MKEKVKPTVISHNTETGSEVKRDYWYHKRIFKKNFLDSFEEKELLIYFFITLGISIILTSIIVLNNGDYEVLKEIIELLISYFSISIGFSFTALIFIIQSFNNKDESNELIEKIASLISFYIIHGLIIIALSLIEIVIGRLIVITGFFYELSNFLVILFFIFMMLFNIYIFYKIIKVVYHFTLSNLYK